MQLRLCNLFLSQFKPQHLSTRRLIAPVFLFVSLSLTPTPRTAATVMPLKSGIGSRHSSAQNLSVLPTPRPFRVLMKQVFAVAFRAPHAWTPFSCLSPPYSLLSCCLDCSVFLRHAGVFLTLGICACPAFCAAISRWPGPALGSAGDGIVLDASALPQ